MQKPSKTPADYIVVAISPILIMLLVGSLAFFLIQVFYRGAMVHGVRWVMFWFVMAIVLVSRIGIEQGKAPARFYGVALAVVSWFYLIHTHGTAVLGALLLAVTWWCAHQLTVDCTLIREDEDASGEGVLQGLWRVLETVIDPSSGQPPKLPPLSPVDALIAESLARRSARQPPRPPGRTLLWFSLAALPLFGIGQLFLPVDDPHARLVGFAFLVLYLAAALSLLATTSFLGLRRYLRQRFAEMPANVTWAWMKFAFFLSAGALLLSMILPRPGANYTWKELAYRIETRQHRASDYAPPFNPPGEGEGAAGDQPAESEQRSIDSRRPAAANGGVRPPRDGRPVPDSRASSNPATSSGDGSGQGEGHGSSGDQGNDVQPVDQARPDNRSGNGSSPSQTVRVKDVTGPASGDDSSADSHPPTARDNGTEQVRDGEDGRLVVDKSAEERPSASKPVSKSKDPKKITAPDRKPQPEPPASLAPSTREPGQLLARLLHALILVALAALLLWFLVRYRKVIADMIRSFMKAVREFLRKLLTIQWRPRPKARATAPPPVPDPEPFASYENPFATGKDKTWSPDRLLGYTFEALRACAKEQGISLPPHQTPRELCLRLLERFPDSGAELENFSFYYNHLAFAQRLPNDFETVSLRRLWQYLEDSALIGRPVPAAKAA